MVDIYNAVTRETTQNTVLTANAAIASVCLAGSVVSFDVTAYGTFCVLGFTIAKIVERVLGKDVVIPHSHILTGVVGGYAVTKACFTDLTFSEFAKASLAVLCASPFVILFTTITVIFGTAVVWHSKKLTD